MLMMPMIADFLGLSGGTCHSMHACPAQNVGCPYEHDSCHCAAAAMCVVSGCNMACQCCHHLHVQQG